MDSNSNQSFFDSNVAWLKSNLPKQQSDKIFSNIPNFESLLQLSQDDFHLEYTLPVFKALEAPRRISFHPVEASIIGESTANSIEAAAANAIGATNFSLLSYTFAACPSTIKPDVQQPNHNLLLLGSYSLPALLQKLLSKDDKFISYQTIILAESSISSFLSSLQYLNFAHFIELLRTLNISFHLVLEDTYDLLSENLYDYFSKINPFLIFGLDVATQPLLSPILVELEDWVLSQGGIGYRYVSNLGFTTDELNQSLNSLITYHRNPQMKGLHSCASDNQLLSVVTGSGPSLDEHLDWLNKYKDSLTIYAAGSSVRSLLSHGIKPSFLVVQERDPVVYDYLLEVSTEYPELRDITLLGSDTIDPRNFTLFDSFFVFQRPLSTVSALFCEFRPSILPIAGPESVNASVESVLMMGSANVLLLGCAFAAPKDIGKI